MTFPILDEEHKFRRIAESNGAAVVYFKDVVHELSDLFQTKWESCKVRVIDADNLKIITNQDHVIFELADEEEDDA